MKSLKLGLLGLAALVPFSTQATSLDLTAGGNGFVNSAYFTWVDAASTGTGLIDPFVRVQDNGIADGYNADARGVMPDVNTSPQFTKDIQLSSVPIVKLGNIDYYEFLLDINQHNNGNEGLLSLDKIDIYTRGSALTSADELSDLTGVGSTLRYSLDTGNAANEILLNYSLNHGSGSGDMLAYIPKSLFGAESEYLYLYSQFGEKGLIGFTVPKNANQEPEPIFGDYSENDGFEEWSLRERTDPPTVPDGGATVALLGFGTLALAALRRKS